MIKLDLKKDLKAFYSPSAKAVSEVDVPELNFAQVDGVIEPGCRPGDSPSFRAAMSALYGISYTLKFMLKKRAQNPVDYPVMALEALWSLDSGEYDFNNADGWQWTAMIMQPTVVTAEDWAEGLERLKKKQPDNPALSIIRLEAFREGPAIQIMHIGPYATEPETLAKMDAYARANGLQLHGRHHEIYLGDPMRADPDKLKTILRHPVKR